MNSKFFHTLAPSITRGYRWLRHNVWQTIWFISSIFFFEYLFFKCQIISQDKVIYHCESLGLTRVKVIGFFHRLLRLKGQRSFQGWWIDWPPFLISRLSSLCSQVLSIDQSMLNGQQFRSLSMRLNQINCTFNVHKLPGAGGFAFASDDFGSCNILFIIVKPCKIGNH